MSKEDYPKKYKLEKYLNRPTVFVSNIVTAIGSGVSVAGFFANDLESVVLGGVLFFGGGFTNASEYMKAYLKTKVEYMNDHL